MSESVFVAFFCVKLGDLLQKNSRCLFLGLHLLFFFVLFLGLFLAFLLFNDFELYKVDAHTALFYCLYLVVVYCNAFV